MSNSRNTYVLGPQHAGWFVWEKGMRGPVPAKISKDRVLYLTREEWNAKTLKSWVLLESEFALSLEELVKKYPLS